MKKIKTAENTKSQRDDKTRSGEVIKFEERHGELKRKINYKTEIAATTKKPNIIESLTMSKQAEGVVDAGVTALLHCKEDTNDAATVKMRSGRLVVEAEAVHHSIEYTNANAAATEYDHKEVGFVAEAAAAIHSNGNAFAE